MKNSAAGWDDISARIVKQFYPLFIKPLCHTLNLSISQGVFPDEMKLAKVIPLFKKGCKFKVNNYRPVSILSIFSKILERLMFNRLLKYINKNKILYSCQFGFRKKYATFMAVTYLVEKISNSLDVGDFTLGVFLDFSKAFDTVNHEILFAKLECYGIRGLANDWFKSYLSNRQQYVSIDDTESDKLSITCGVPQGSVLGPLLFLIYINDIANVSDILYLVLFADDSNAFLSGSDVNYLVSTMNIELRKVIEWLNTNKLSLNIDKSHFMLFNRRKKVTLDPICINGTALQRVYDTKFLGIIIDSQLTWKHHLTYIKGKIARGIGILNKARKVLTTQTLITLYYSFIYPYLTYGIEVWGGTCQRYLSGIIKLQKRIIRMISNVGRYESTVPLFKDLQLLNVTKLYCFRLLLFMYKNEHNELPDAFEGMFIRNFSIHSYVTRQMNYFRIPRVRLEVSKQTTIYKAIEVYNKSCSLFDYTLRLGKFKQLVKMYLVNNDSLI